MSDHSDPLAESRTTPVRLVTCHDPAAEAMARAGRERPAGGVSPAPATPDTPDTSNGRTHDLSGPCRTITVHHHIADDSMSGDLLFSIQDLADYVGDVDTVTDAPCRDHVTLRDLIRAVRAADVPYLRRRHAGWISRCWDQDFLQLRVISRAKTGEITTVIAHGRGVYVEFKGAPSLPQLLGALAAIGWTVDGVS